MWHLRAGFNVAALARRGEGAAAPVANATLARLETPAPPTIQPAVKAIPQILDQRVTPTPDAPDPMPGE